MWGRTSQYWPWSWDTTCSGMYPGQTRAFTYAANQIFPLASLIPATGSMWLVSVALVDVLHLLLCIQVDEFPWQFIWHIWYEIWPYTKEFFVPDTGFCYMEVLCRLILYYVWQLYCIASFIPTLCLHFYSLFYSTKSSYNNCLLTAQSCICNGRWRHLNHQDVSSYYLLQ